MYYLQYDTCMFTRKRLLERMLSLHMLSHIDICNASDLMAVLVNSSNLPTVDDDFINNATREKTTPLMIAAGNSDIHFDGDKTQIVIDQGR